MGYFPFTVTLCPLGNTKELPSAILNRAFRLALNEHLNVSPLFSRMIRTYAGVLHIDLTYTQLRYQTNMIDPPNKNRGKAGLCHSV